MKTTLHIAMRCIFVWAAELCEGDSRNSEDDFSFLLVYVATGKHKVLYGFLEAKLWGPTSDLRGNRDL